MASMSFERPNVAGGKSDEAKEDVARLIRRLNLEWDLGLQSFDGSPQRGSFNGSEAPIEVKCAAKIRFLSWKASVDPLWNKFEKAATALYMGWVNKARAERGVLPESTHKRHPISPGERAQLLDLLLEIASRECNKVGHQPTPESILRRAREGSPSATRTKSQYQESIDDTPIKSSLPRPASDTKRQRDELFPDAPSASAKKIRPLLTEKSTNANISFTTIASTNNSIIFSSGSNLELGNTQDTAPDDNPSPLKPQTATQPFSGKNFEVPQPDKPKSSDYGSSSFEFSAAPDHPINGTQLSPDVTNNPNEGEDDGLSQDLLEIALAESIRTPDAERSDTDEEFEQPELTAVSDSELELGVEVLKAKLEGTFGSLSEQRPLKHASFAIQYEVLRICLYTQVRISQIIFPLNMSCFDDYNELWAFLKRQPALAGKSFPERCSHQAWNATFDKFQSANHVVAFGGALSFDTDVASEGLFKLQLRPMILDKGHRLGRRLGHDRFLEIDMPNFDGKRTPKTLQALGNRGRETLIEWLVDGPHLFLGRNWRPFCVKPQDRKKRTSASKSPVEETPNRVSFFAVDGSGFIPCRGRIPETLKPNHFTLTLDQVLNLVRPTRKNKSQPYLKLFQRTTLVLSKNVESVLLEADQIRFKEDIAYNGEVMTDGAGRISRNLATRIANRLRLKYVPSSFQGRLGEAKGLWTIDHSDRSDDDWIEVYASQCKWSRSSKRGGESEDRCHRAFEINDWSAPLKSADLNTQFLPLLMERAKDKQVMKKHISELLTVGLDRELAKLREAMSSPESLRQWVREMRSNINERIRNRSVAYKAGIPDAAEERLNMLLDSGFDPHHLFFMKDLAKQLFKQKCDDLKEKMNITVGKSAYVFMVPDFWGVLVEGEVYLDLSSFEDEVAGFSGMILPGQDVLVARSPAHFISDIQKVRAVARADFMGLRDIIIFSTKASKGNKSLASMLSGGDFDGDRAWVCWEPTIVNNFESAAVPECPNLIEEGFIRKDDTKYGELVAGLSEPAATSLFLKKSFDFNMRQNMLGICTTWKDRMCYTNGYSCEASVWASQLLSDLVDQAKQGFGFDDEDFKRIKVALNTKFSMNLPVEKLPWKDGVTRPNSKNIIDHVTAVAHDTIERCLTEYQNSVKSPPSWDEDLVMMFKWAKGESETCEEWKSLLAHLISELKLLKEAWSKSWNNRKCEEDKPDFATTLLESHEMYLNIKPNIDTPLSRLLLPSNLDPEQTQWAALKASALFASYSKGYVAKFAWYMGGKHLALLKANYGKKGFPHAVIPAMYAMQKPDAAYVRRLRGDIQEMEDLGGSTVGSVADLEALDD